MKKQLRTARIPLLLVAFIFFMTISCSYGINRAPEEKEMVKLENPMSVSWLKAHLLKTTPRMVLTPGLENLLKRKIKEDPVTRNYYAAMKINAKDILGEDLLTRKMVGRRLLGTSREMLYRMNILAMVYRIDKDPVILKRIGEELTAVCHFTDWNPSHFLDVAEMSMAVALALDWAGKGLPKSTVELAMNSLIEKGIKPSYAEKGMGWIRGTNNWNQVCNGGMIAASIAIAGKDPELAARTIARSLDGMPYALQEYAPDGVYPEGSTYWGYGTSFSVITSSMLTSAFGTDFGLAAYPAFMKSADFRMLSVAPSGWYFNYADCGDRNGEGGDITLVWFATYSGNSTWFEKEKFLMPPGSMGKLSRLAGAGLVWLAGFEPKMTTPLPLSWKGDGFNPIVLFRGSEKNPGNFYFGGKGGKATTSHGNMDAGSFVLEIDSVRWSVDPGNQDYNAIEQTGFDLWGNCQECQRWQLLTKNNFGHSTLSVNNALFVNNGFASLKEFKAGVNPEATFDMTAVYGDNLTAAIRRFAKESERSLLIEDQFTLSKTTHLLTWQMITTAEVEIVRGGAILRQSGKKLKLENLDHPELMVSVISLDPPPFYLDRKISGLKRIEIRLPAYLVKDGKGSFKVRLTGI